MVNSKIDMKVPSVEILSYEDLYKRVIADDVEVHAILSRFVGDFEGALLFVLSDAAADKLAGLMMGSDVEGVSRSQGFSRKRADEHRGKLVSSGNRDDA